MKVLFVAGANGSRQQATVPFIEAQGESLRRHGVDVHYFPVTGRGLRGYLRNVPRLKKWLRENPVDLIHAHYTLSGWVSVLARPKAPVVLSLMGSDAYGEYVGPDRVKLRSRHLTLLTWLIQPFLRGIICKSANIEQYVYRRSISRVIPNGVRMDQFRIYENGCRAELGLDPRKKYVLFLGNPRNVRKNFPLAEAAVRLLGRPEVELIAPYPISHDEVVRYLNSVDALAMCSFMEGSPNVVKEAMACNCPMVVTDAGDAAWVVGRTPGCYVASFEAQDYARKLEQALDFAARQGRTQGRKQLLALQLDDDSIAERIIEHYRQACGRPLQPTDPLHT